MDLETMVSSPAQKVEVLAKPQRRKFTVDYNLRILREVNGCKRPGEVGALLRREGLYWSSVSRWRKAWENGELSRTGAKKRGPIGKPVDERDKRIAELELKWLRARAERAEALVEVQKKSPSSWAWSFRRRTNSARRTDGADRGSGIPIGGGAYV